MAMKNLNSIFSRFGQTKMVNNCQKAVLMVCFVWPCLGFLQGQVPSFELDTVLNAHQKKGATEVEQWIGLPGGVQALSADNKGRMVVWDWPSLKQDQWLEEHQTGINALVVAPGGASIFSADGSGRIREFRYPGMLLLKAFIASFDVVCYVNFNPKHASLLIAGYHSNLRETSDGLVRVGNPDRMRDVRRLAASKFYPNGYSYGITDAWLDASKQEVWYADGFQIFVRSLPEGELLRTYLSPTVSNNLLVSGNQLYVWASGTVHRWPIDAPGEMPEASHLLYPTELGYCRLFKAPGKPWLITGDVQGKVYVLHADDLRVLAEWKAHEGGVRSLWMPADEQALVTTGLDGLIKIWRPKEELLVLEDSPVGEVKDNQVVLLPKGLVEQRPWPATDVPEGTFNLNLRDAQQVDGDSVSVYLNDTLWMGDVAITGQGISAELTLKKGTYRLGVVPLNEGDVAPNTAVLLLTGPKEFRARKVLRSSPGEVLVWELLVE